MTFTLRKPPIIESWIRTKMVSASESEWRWEDVGSLLESYSDELPELEMLPEVTHQPKGVEQGELTKEIEIHVRPQYLRARTASRSKIVQVGRGELLVIHTRDATQPYPGFDRMLADFRDSLARYYEHIPAEGVESAELHDVDLIVIPQMYACDLGPRDYFEGAPVFPERPFGDVASVSWSSLFSRPDSPDFAQLSVQMLPPDEGDGRFRLDWHCWCPELPADDEGAIAERLRSAHNYLKLCFRAVCKKPVWDLFEPVEES